MDKSEMMLKSAEYQKKVEVIVAEENCFKIVTVGSDSSVACMSS